MSPAIPSDAWRCPLRALFHHRWTRLLRLRASVLCSNHFKQAVTEWMSMIIRHDLPIMPTNLFLPFLPFKIQASTIQPSSSMWSAKTLGLLARDHWCVLVPLDFLVWEMYMSKAWHGITWRLVGKVCFHQAFKTSRFDLTVTWPMATGYGLNWI